ncbi:GIY-YIG nuclease family protein [Rhodococcus sp. HNM0569]|uniref:GIY-YIG nuclease family protein n=1 Tax=Rhodococcus sp. HNM0569 TaxID=2716340 RepID=UPI00146AB247|nr:GIY-YIG nuclease family protein [Rhodococcus sp. HNM0569]NLU83942.1 GIY-YIG nuclease family protein [Rhodococcus sp. HNM0569]
MATVWTIPLDITSRWLDSAEVRSFLASNDIPDASADPLVRIAQFVDVTNSLERNIGRTFHSVQAAAAALFDGIEGGVPVALKLAATRLVLREVYQTRPVPVPLASRVADELGGYTYAVVDPRSRTVFHVGAGRGNDVFALVWEALAQTDHLETATRAELPDDVRARVVTTIRDIYDSGLEAEHWILDHGAEFEHRPAAEGQVLASTRALALAQRPDLVPGPQVGAVRIEDLAVRYSAEPAPDLPTPALLLEVPGAARHGLTPDEIRDVAKGPWAAGSAVRQVADLPVFVFADDVVRAVFRISDWSVAARIDDGQLWQFAATTDQDLSARFVGTRLTPNRAGLKKWPASGWVPRLTRALPGR